jgi:16S rRNA G966 N2-methylase RsmD
VDREGHREVLDEGCDLITDDDIEKAVEYLRTNARAAAQAKANRIYTEEYRRVVKGQIQRENDDKALGAQEAIAYADPRYRQHLEAMKEAIEKDEYNRWMMTAAEAKIEAWRTQQANQRAEGKAYN